MCLDFLSCGGNTNLMIKEVFSRKHNWMRPVTGFFCHHYCFIKTSWRNNISTYWSCILSSQELRPSLSLPWTVLQLSPNSDPISLRLCSCLYPGMLLIHCSESILFLAQQSSKTPLGGPNSGPQLCHIVISHSPSQAHCKKVLVSKNTLHIEVLYACVHTHIYPHIYI